MCDASALTRWECPETSLQSRSTRAVASGPSSQNGRQAIDEAGGGWKGFGHESIGTATMFLRRVAVNRRVRRKIGYNGVLLSFERARPSAR